MQEMRIFGPPGTGKTTKLSKEVIPKLAFIYDPQKIMITSFTRAAAEELASKLDEYNPDIVGTLHSICYRALRFPELTEKHMSEWNKEHPSLQIDSEMKKPGAEKMAQYQTLRNKMVPRESWPAIVSEFAEIWEDWKRRNRYMDFMDLIETAGGLFSPPGSPAAIVVDEAQDFSRLEMSVIRRWGTQVKELWVCGDEDQCLVLNDTNVLTLNGEKPAIDLNPQTDRLQCYDKAHTQITKNKGEGFHFKLSTRNYTGPVFKFQAENKTVQCTDNHYWYVKWNDVNRNTCWKVVYLMQKGDWFRVGMCQLFRSEKSANKPPSLHIGHRMRAEKADKIWILKIFNDVRDASIYEGYIAARYGISTIFFRDYTDNVHNRCLYTADRIEWLYKNIPDQYNKAKECLSDHTLSIEYPFYSIKIGQDRSSGTSIMKMRAINIAKMSEAHSFFKVPVNSGKNRRDVSWKPLHIECEYEKDIEVFSVGVLPHKTFVANGLCTCNCLYSFTGASPINMLEPPLPPEQKMVLGQSYRIPASVHRLAEKVIHRVKTREEKQYLPRMEEGETHFCPESILNADWIVNKALSLPGKTMILTSCNYMLHGVIAELKERGIPFANPWKPEEKSWNPISNKTCQFFIDFLSCGEDAPYWTTQQFCSFAQYLKVGETGLIRKQGKAGIKRLITLLEEHPDTPGLHTCREYIGQIMSPGAIDPAISRDYEWLVNNVMKDKVTPLKYPIKIFKTGGIEALKKDPDIYIGTVHSVKGAGSENVIISPDVSYAGIMDSFSKEGYENLCRLFYVGITRTKNRLFILSPSSKHFFEF